MRYIDEMDIDGKRVLLRVDYNVPMENGRVEDDARIKASLPTIRYALDRGCSLVIISHMGRPKGKAVPELSLAPVSEHLSRLLGRSVRFVGDIVGPKARQAAEELWPGEMLMLENLRFDPREEENDKEFSRELASYGQVYIDDAFSNAHRAHASNVGVVRYLPESGGGLQMKTELSSLQRALDLPRRPLVAVIGGAKVAGKIAALENLHGRVDKMLLGGGMAYPFLAAQGRPVDGASPDEATVERARGMLERDRDHKLVFPVDMVAADRKSEDAFAEVVPIDELGNRLGLDIGPRTAQIFREEIARAGTVIWNGPMGVFEMEPFSHGTRTVAEAIAASPAFSLVGGGDTGSALDQYGLRDRTSYVSTGGGAFLEALTGRELPAVEALDTDKGMITTRTIA
jgi:phosphoglycerate kinase|nr:phosphoglycerate kinase [Methanomassiliicoccus luminyensis]